MRLISLFLCSFTLISCPIRAEASYPSDPQPLPLAVYKVGAGMYDITGPAAELGMMGYAMMDQKTAGIHLRLWSRAFVILDPSTSERFVYVNTDLFFVTQTVRTKVIEKLKGKYGSWYDYHNVMLGANHTHSGPGGFSTSRLYNLTIFGFSEENFNTIVNGIFESIVRAHENMQDATLRIATGELLGANINRSQPAYQLNPASERALYPYDNDKEMVLLRFDSLSGEPIGMINWFAVHATSMENQNHLISSDNKGWASYLFEKDMGAHYLNTKSFVAAFANSNEGDASPNVSKDLDGDGDWDCPENENFKCTKESALKQYNRAKELYSGANTLITGPVEGKHHFVDFSRIEILPQFTGGYTAKSTCDAAIGISMLAGAPEDGPGYGKEGVSCEELSDILETFFCDITHDDCQSNKPVVLAMGKFDPKWTPNILPVHITRIGQLALIAVPAEFTTMAGRRLRKAVEKILSPIGVKYVVIAGIANAYSGYVTTPEEYRAQCYEGASTHFGEYTLGAYLQEFSRVALALRFGNELEPGPQPPDLLENMNSLRPEIPPDAVPKGKKFGDMHSGAKPRYSIGETVAVKFWSSHLSNDPMVMRSFLEVQRLNLAHEWETIRYDWDPDTILSWERYQKNNSIVTAQWNTGTDTKPGIHRIVHGGYYKNSDEQLIPFEGKSAEFEISN